MKKILNLIHTVLFESRIYLKQIAEDINAIRKIVTCMDARSAAMDLTTKETQEHLNALINASADLLAQVKLPQGPDAEVVDDIDKDIEAHPEKYFDTYSDGRGGIICVAKDLKQLPKETRDAIVDIINEKAEKDSKSMTFAKGKKVLAVTPEDIDKLIDDRARKEAAEASALLRDKPVLAKDAKFIMIQSGRASKHKGFANVQRIAEHFHVSGWDLTHAIRFAGIVPVYKVGAINYYPIDPDTLRRMWEAYETLFVEVDE